MKQIVALLTLCSILLFNCINENMSEETHADEIPKQSHSLSIETLRQRTYPGSDITITRAVEENEQYTSHRSKPQPNSMRE